MSGKNLVTFFFLAFNFSFPFMPHIHISCLLSFFFWAAFVLFAFYEPQYNVLISLGGKIQFLISDFVIVSFVATLDGISTCFFFHFSLNAFFFSFTVLFVTYT